MKTEATNGKVDMAPLVEALKWKGKLKGAKRRVDASKIATAIRADRDAQQRERLTNLRDAIAMGTQSADSGDLHDWDKAVQIEIKALGRARRS